MYIDEPQSEYQAAFRPLGLHLTLAPDVEYPWPEDIVRACREFDPRLVPIFRKKYYRSQANGVYCFRHFGFAAFDPEKPTDPALLRATKPVTPGYARSITTPAPNIIIRWFEPKIEPGSRRFMYNLPPGFVPFTSWVERWVEETYWEGRAAEKAAYAEEHGESARNTRESDAASEEAGYRVQNDRVWNQKLLDKVGADDLREIRERAAGVDYRATRPSVDLGGSP